MGLVDIQGKLRLALGSVKDHASIGKAMMYHHPHDGFSRIEIAVVRATGHDNGTIDDKYMHEILFLVSNSPGSIPFLAERISRRLCKTKDRLVALKTLVLIHRLLRGGNRCFEQELRKAHVSGHLQISIRCFLNNSDPSLGFLHKYAAYLEERMNWLINQAGKLEPVMSNGLQFRPYDERSIDMVFRTLPRCQVFIDKVLDCSPVDILPSDTLAQAAMSNTLRESFQVYMKFSEGIAALVNMFFDLTASARGLACQILKKASLQSQKLHDLYQNCKQIVENKNLVYPSVQIISMAHIMALDQCLGSPQNQLPVHSQVSLSGKTTIAKPVPLKRSAELGLELAVTGKESKNVQEKTLSPTLFSLKLETKINKVWVLFEDEAPAPSGSQQNTGDVVNNINCEYSTATMYS
ncbi:hypothetical protein L6164_006215 [Bauhinia variegata]|uniref:Uncharacterized protein n=1 Tax=Bauhinia variegata TaxID=167791 RepID=A0ACB9PSX7_BAUVA|nr:hypothetical protein L6164_006215 [Bauhinia variegata]